MDEKDLVVDDEFLQASASKCKAVGAQLEQILTEYIQILKDIHTDALVAGSISVALGGFIDTASLMNGMISGNADQIDIDLRAYDSGISEADSYLF